MAVYFAAAAVVVLLSIIATMYIVNGCTDPHTRERPFHLPYWLRRGCTASSAEDRPHPDALNTIYVGYMCTALSRMVQTASSLWPWNDPNNRAGEVLADFAALVQRDGFVRGATVDVPYVPRGNCSVLLALGGGGGVPSVLAHVVPEGAAVRPNTPAYVAPGGTCGGSIELVAVSLVPTVAMAWRGANATVVVVWSGLNVTGATFVASTPMTAPLPPVNGTVTTFAPVGGTPQTVIVAYADAPNPADLVQIATVLHMLHPSKRERVAVWVLDRLSLSAAIAANAEVRAAVFAAGAVVEVFETGGAGTAAVVTLPIGTAPSVATGIAVLSDSGTPVFASEATLPSKTPLARTWIGVTGRVRSFAGAPGGELTVFTNAADVSVGAVEAGAVALLAVVKFATQ